MAYPKSDILLEHSEEPLDDGADDFDALADEASFAKTKITCVCPGCGKMHIMQIRWIGRGVPRKFCQSCRERESAFDH